MIKTLKIMLIPNNKQRSKLFQSAGVARFVYNWTLNAEQENYKNGGSFLSDNDLRKQFTKLKMTQEYNNLSAICKKYNYIGDPVEISTGNFFYADDVYTAQEYGDQFSVRINLNSEQNIESFGKNRSCSLDSRIIRNNFTDNILSISEIQVLINKFNEMNGVISAYNEEYPDFQSDYFNSEYVNNKKSIKDLEELITLKREKEKINQQIDGLNKYVTYGKYGNKENSNRNT